MKWPVEFHDDFQPAFFAPPLEVQRTILTISRLLGEFGPQLEHPRAETLNGSRHANKKEMRSSAADGKLRLVSACDPARNAMLLFAGDKSGGSAKRFQRTLLRKTDELFDRHLARLAKEGES